MESFIEVVKRCWTFGYWRYIRYHIIIIIITIWEQYVASRAFGFREKKDLASFAKFFFSFSNCVSFSWKYDSLFEFFRHHLCVYSCAAFKKGIYTLRNCAKEKKSALFHHHHQIENRNDAIIKQQYKRSCISSENQNRFEKLCIYTKNCCVGIKFFLMWFSRDQGSCGFWVPKCNGRENKMAPPLLHAVEGTTMFYLRKLDVHCYQSNKVELKQPF